mgnify:CR=1 FL=1
MSLQELPEPFRLHALDTLKEAIDYATQKVQDAQKEAKALKASEQ